ncbi:hypothetical protein FEM48_Zijuj08G0173300 [Ziziphus jujuba var. spinosa]|uniref:Uncharacterized protein n=1 Tax=Ziziphus jujuba var. spinosa TaxID=714518 RepID=A0A978V0D7_ZIZJJ|nr:hypothetical protein FEM48_Zijuj08G0173300 [Ziziphus jujuba var. spinosa]
MEKLGQDLKRGFLHMIESIKSCRPTQGMQDGKEPNLGSDEQINVEDRGIRMKAARGPKRPGVPKGSSPQTS